MLADIQFSQTLDNSHLKLSGQIILVQDLIHYTLTGQSLLHHQQISQTDAQTILYWLARLIRNPPLTDQLVTLLSGSALL